MFQPLAANKLRYKPGHRCHYCQVYLLRPGSPEALVRRDDCWTADHTVPKCDGGNKTVPCFAGCNRVKGNDPYELFLAFAKRCSNVRPHTRKRQYREFRDRVIAAGLSVLHGGKPAARTSLTSSLAELTCTNDQA